MNTDPAPTREDAMREGTTGPQPESAEVWTDEQKVVAHEIGLVLDASPSFLYVARAAIVALDEHRANVAMTAAISRDAEAYRASRTVAGEPDALDQRFHQYMLKRYGYGYGFRHIMAEKDAFFAGASVSPQPRLPSNVMPSLIGLLEAIADPRNDPNDDAADAVTAMMVWRREAADILAALSDSAPSEGKP